MKKWAQPLLWAGFVIGLLAVLNATAAEPNPPVAPMHAHVHWEPPTENVDGTALAECGEGHEHGVDTDPDCLDGYVLYIGDAPRTYDEQIDITGEWLREYTYDGSARGEGQIYLALTAYDSAGQESAYSGEVTKELTSEPTPTGDRPVIFVE